MSVTTTPTAITTTPAPANAPARSHPGLRRSTLLRWTAGSGIVASALAVAAIALWPASEADKARTDGRQFGEAVAQLSSATSSAEVDAALTEMNAALVDTRDHAGDAVAEQVSDQADALDRAVDGFAGSTTSDDAFEQDLYEYELDVALDDLSSQADEFRTTCPEVQQAFWDGYETGVNGG